LAFLKTIETREFVNSWRETKFLQQKSIVDQYFKNDSNGLVLFGADFNIEYFSPFNISSSFPKRKLFLSGWVTNNPSNINKFESFLDLINKNAIFFNKRTFQEMEVNIKKSILINYNISVDAKIVLESSDYIIVRFYRQI
jgi:hypothetical protein